jgi:hypothetical protein
LDHLGIRGCLILYGDDIGILYGIIVGDKGELNPNQIKNTSKSIPKKDVPSCKHTKRCGKSMVPSFISRSSS